MVTLNGTFLWAPKINIKTEGLDNITILRKKTYLTYDPCREELMTLSQSFWKLVASTVFKNQSFWKLVAIIVFKNQSFESLLLCFFKINRFESLFQVLFLKINRFESLLQVLFLNNQSFRKLVASIVF